ncbi:inosine/xanthosine triphosphatase [Halobaculum sp. WSA2]|uniref:Probable inosine/xanthosine triphosphatase n=1 Tax=Halobaculum saliterrae TaxID=2073113 RepID=A0A6B0SX63_9EURY|nr:inosine/xanthosine triphosphatase [Halobaculum saliterrae]MXR41221.1 inosine/xanthosine triphosphatase [Halobaculum saliterrae]
MRIGVGSGNPVKREATERAVTGEDGFGDDAVVEACPVPSGVSEQPSGHDETRAGAVNRANAVLDAADEPYDLGVGIEGGVAEYEGDDGLYLVMWAAVTDGERVGDGAGPSLALPGRIATRVRDGEELGPVMDDVLGESDVARKQGAAGALTGGRVDRTDALRTAVAGALGPFVTDLY